MFGRRRRQHSVWLFPLNTGSCNACDQEIQALHAARYTLAQQGISFASSPRHADILLLTGVQTPRSRQAARLVWEQLAEPRAIVAVGDCPINGSVFGRTASADNADDLLPIDVELPGCPPSPALILEGIEAAVRLLAGEEATGDEAEEAEPKDAVAENLPPTAADEQMDDADDEAADEEGQP